MTGGFFYLLPLLYHLIGFEMLYFLQEFELDIYIFLPCAIMKEIIRTRRFFCR